MPIAGFRPYEFEHPITTERLLLRPLGPTDLDDVHAYQSREDVCRYLLFEPRSRDDVAGRLEQYAAATRLAIDGDYMQIGMQLNDADAGARVVGDVYFTISSLENLRGEIGWTLHPDFAGRGFATEAADAVLRIAFEHLGLHRVFAELDPRNDASIRLCQRLGMRAEAYFVEEMMFKGAWADTGIYALLADEWATRHGGITNRRYGDL